MLPVTALLAIPVAVAAVDGARKSPGRWVAPAAVTALIGFAGVAGWVSYAFGPARLLFLLPLGVARDCGGSAFRAARRNRDRGSAPGREPGGHRELLPGARSPEHRLPGADGIASRGISPAVRRRPTRSCWSTEPNLSGVGSGVLSAGLHYAADFYGARCRSGAAGNRAIPRSGTCGSCGILATSRRAMCWSIWRTIYSDLREGELHPYTPFSPTHKALMRAANVQVSTDFSYAAWEFREL